jgi:DNA binding domain, excisionase family
MSNVIPFTPRPTPTHPQPSNETTHATPTPISRAVYTVAEAAELLSLSLNSTYALIRSGDIPARKLGGRWVISRRRFHDWLDQLPEATTEDVRRELDRLERAEQRANRRNA